MKVLMFGWEFPPHITGGLGTACYGLTKGLSHHGHEIIFVVPKAYGDEDQSFIKLEQAEGTQISEKIYTNHEFWSKLTYIEVGSKLIPYLSPEEYEKIQNDEFYENKTDFESVFSPGFKFSGKYGPSLLEEVSRYALLGSVIASNYDFDVIHAHDWLTYKAGIAAKEVTGKPLVVHMHATEFDRTGENVNTIIYEIEREGMQAADKVIAVSNLTRNIVIEKYGISPDKVVVVHNAVEPVEHISKPSLTKGVDEKIVTFLGRITYQKGPEYFVEAAAKVLEKNKNVRFVMAGSGDMMNKIIKRVAQLKISDKFHFAGFLKGDEVQNMFQMSDVYVMPSVSEPFGISPLEAMRSNVPVIISKQSGVSEILKHAIKVDFWDVEAMADAIYGLIQYQGLNTMFKTYGKHEVDSLKWEKAAVHVADVYQSVYEQK